MSIYFYMRINSQENGDETRYYRQERVLRACAEENGYPFDIDDDEKAGNVFKDSCSGTHFSREGWHKLEHCVKKGDTIIMKEISRFTTDADYGHFEYMQLYQIGVNIEFLENPTASTEYITELAEKMESVRSIFNIEKEALMPVLVFAALDRGLSERAMFQQKIAEGMDASEKRPGRPKHGFEKLTPELRIDIEKNLKGIGDKDRYQLMVEYDVSINTLSAYFHYVQDELRKKEMQEKDTNNEEGNGE